MGATPNLKPTLATGSGSETTEQPAVASAPSVADRTYLRVKTTVVAGLAAGMLLSPKLWVSTRFYPLVPVFHWLPRVPYPLDYICYAALLLLLGAIAFAAKPRIYILAFVTFMGLYALLDQTRWQPWAWQYWLTLIAFGCYSGKPDDLIGQRDTLNICRLIMGCTYFYSGFQKLNADFVSYGMPWVLGTLRFHIPGVHYIGYVVPFIEVSIGLCLLTRRFRKIGIINGIIMHIFILYSFGPLGLNWNSVVWPWNVVMIALILLLFRNTDATFGEILWRNHFAYQKIVLILLGVLPSLSFIGYWPSDLSLCLYTANLTQAQVVVSENAKRQLPAPVQPYVKLIDGHLILRTQDWSFGEMNVPPYADTESFISIGKQVCRWTNYSPDVLLSGYEKSTLLGKGKEIRNTCFGTLMDIKP
jgi:methylamine utilization protein MauE